MNRNLSNCEKARKKGFRGFNGIRTCGLSIAASMILVLSLVNFSHSFSDIDDCVRVNCSGNGECVDHVGGYTCDCKTGFYGVNCEIGTTGTCG